MLIGRGQYWTRGPKYRSRGTSAVSNGSVSSNFSYFVGQSVLGGLGGSWGDQNHTNNIGFPIVFVQLLQGEAGHMVAKCQSLESLKGLGSVQGGLGRSWGLLKVFGESLQGSLGILKMSKVLLHGILEVVNHPESVLGAS